MFFLNKNKNNGTKDYNNLIVYFLLKININNNNKFCIYLKIGAIFHISFIFFCTNNINNSISINNFQQFSNKINYNNLS